MNQKYKNSAFLAVDVQVDFCPGGRLAVADGDVVVPLSHRLARLFPRARLWPVFGSPGAQETPSAAIKTKESAKR
jgi:nicotinamidase-related amidase